MSVAAGTIARRTPLRAATRSAARSVPRVDLLLAIIALGATALWLQALGRVDLHDVSGLGIVSALPLSAFAALALVTVSFALVLRRPDVSTPVALLHLGLLILMLHGATGLIDDVPAFNVVWRHAGVTDYVLQTGRVDPHIDAYFNWPGFFFLAALATRAAGLESTLGLSRFAPVAFELMYLPALVVIARAFTADRRLSWLAVWIFYMTNWVGQDYFSPQAMAYLLYLALIAVVLTCFARTMAPDFATWRALGVRAMERVRLRPRGVTLAETAAAHRTTSYQRSLLVPVCVVLIAAAVGSHQLTPFMMLSSLIVLVGLRRSTARGLPVITTVLIVAWLVYLATAYLDGHLRLLLGQALNVQEAVTANVSNRLAGDPHHLLVVRIRLVMTALVWGLAALGLMRGLRRGESRPSHAILVVAPIGLAILQPYGGEMLMRVYLFSLPFAACFAARAILPAPGWLTSAALAAVGLVLVAGLLFTCYGNEKADLFTNAEVKAVSRLYAIAPKGSVLLAGSTNVPWKQRHYADYHYQLLSRQLRFGGRPTPAQLAETIARYMRGTKTPSFLLITRSQRIYDRLLGAPGWGSSTDILRAVRSSPAFRTAFDDGDGQIFVLSDRAPRSPAAASESAGARGGSTARTLLAVLFLAIAPGFALIGLLRLSDPWLRAALVLALSLSIDAIVGGVLSYTGSWSPTAAMLILTALSVTGVFGQVALRRAKEGR
jgi:hypothetical protein